MTDNEKPATGQAGKSERAQREEKVLQFWKDNKIFEKSLEKKSPKGEFVFYDGPPFATGLPHFGHILPGTIKDVIPRYKTMQGYKVPRRWGWDCHGLPIENLIEKELGLTTKKDIEKYGIDKFNERAKASVLRYEKEWKEIIPRTGRWVDMDNAYKTMDSSYTESVWWSFKTLFDKGLVYQGFKAMHLCPRCETTLSNFEVNLNYKDITDISVTAEFELVDKPKTYILAWTTTPWTLPGNVALAVNPEIEYAEVEGEVKGNVYIVARSLVEKIFGENHKMIRAFPGRELVGLRYKSIFDYYQSEGKVVAGEFVKEEEGTGIVHIAPAFGEDDYELSLKENLPFIQHVGTDGRFKPEVKDFAGELVKSKEDHQSADVAIIKYLAAKDLLFAKEKITHSYPHCWRCDTPLLNYAASSWFVKVTEIKDELLKSNGKVKWVPEDIRDGRFGKWLEGARDWAVSRSRFWGTPLPVWQNTDRSKTLVIDSLETLKKYAKKSNNKYLMMRHGEGENNVLDIVSNNIDAPHNLTDKGRDEVGKTAQKLKAEKIDLIIASPLLRTKETAYSVAETLGISRSEIIFDERIKEIQTGIFDGKPISQYRQALPSYEEKYEIRPEGGENLLDLRRRAGEFMREIESKYSGKTILVVTHEYVSWMLSAVAAGLDKSQTIALKMNEDFIETGEVRELSYEIIPRNSDHELDLHRPYIDGIVLEKDGEEYHRVPEVFDTWYDSGSVPFASRAASDFKPADFIAEGLDQTRGWFYTLLVLNQALFGGAPYKQVVVNGLILAEDGKKMSKRLNNYPDIREVLDKYGADALRYFLASSPAVHAEDMAFSEKILDEVGKKIINRLYNVVSFYELYLSESSGAGKNTDHVLDKWLDSRLAETCEEITNALERYELDKATRPISDFVDDLSTWYLRRSRNRPEALQKLREVLIEFLKLLAPFMPFAAEDLYQKLKTENDPESIHLCEWPKVENGILSIFKKKDDVLEKMEETRRLVSLALEARQKANIKVRQPLSELKIKNGELGEEYLELIKDEVNIKKVSVDESLAGEVLLDTELTPELEEEGKVRDAIRAIQDWRKDMGLRPNDIADYKMPADEKELFIRNKLKIENSTNVKLIEN